MPKRQRQDKCDCDCCDQKGSLIWISYFDRQEDKHVHYIAPSGLMFQDRSVEDILAKIHGHVFERHNDLQVEGGNGSGLDEELFFLDCLLFDGEAAEDYIQQGLILSHNDTKTDSYFNNNTINFIRTYLKPHFRTACDNKAHDYFQKGKINNKDRFNFVLKIDE